MKTLRALAFGLVSALFTAIIMSPIWGVVYLSYVLFTTTQLNPILVSFITFFTLAWVLFMYAFLLVWGEQLDRLKKSRERRDYLQDFFNKKVKDKRTH